MQDAWRRWLAGETGGVALTFALALPLLALAVGGGIDVSNALSYRQKLASALELGCQQSALEINYQLAQGAPPATNFAPVVNKITAQKIADANLDGSPTATSTAAASKITIDGKGSSPTFFAQVLDRAAFPIAVERQCGYAQPNQAPPIGQTLFLESFETNHTVAQNSWTVLGYNGAKTSGATWNGWTTQNAGIEINGMPQLSGGTIRFGNFFAELDSDCLGASPCHSNSTMSRIVTLQPGTYEVSYWYISRVTEATYATYGAPPPPNPPYGASVHCGLSTDPLVTDATWDGQTDRIELYIEKAGQYTYATPADVCVYSDHWVRRDIYFTVPLASDYRFSWRAAGKEDTFGGLIDYLRLCKNSCP